MLSASDSLANQKANGLFEKSSTGSGPMDAPNIATLFLSEATGLVEPERQQRIAAALPKALGLILQAQAVPKGDRHRGGWRYRPGSKDSDTSCSRWALMALRSAKLNGAAIPDQALRDAVDYFHRHQDEKTGSFGDRNQDDHAVLLTGMSLWYLASPGANSRSINATKPWTRNPRAEHPESLNPARCCR